MGVKERYEERKKKGETAIYSGVRERSVAKEIDGIASSISERTNTWLKNHNNYLTNYNNRYSGRKGSYEDSYVSDASDWLSTISAQKENFDKESTSILSMLDEYGDYLDKNWANSIRSALKTASKHQEKILKSATSDSEFWAQYPTEADYQKDVDAYRKSSLTGDAVTFRQNTYNENAKKIAELEALRDDIKTFGDDGFKENSRKTVEVIKQYGSVDALQAEIDRLKTENNLYERGEGGYTSKTEDDYYAVTQTPEYTMYSKNRNYSNPDLKELEYINSINDVSKWTVDGNGDYYGPDGTTKIIRDENGNYIHPYMLEADLTVEDKLGYFLSMEGDQLSRGLMTPDSGKGTSIWHSVYSEGLIGSWKQLTEDEIGIYYTLYKTKGQEAAYRFLDDMKPVLNKRETEGNITNWKNQYSEANALGKILLNLDTIPQQLQSSIGGFIEDTSATIRGEEINPYSAAHSGMRYSSTVRGEAAANLDKTGIKIPGLNFSLGDAYQSVMSIGDSMLSMALGGPTVGGLLLATGAAENEAYRLYQNGASNEQVVLGAAAAGAMEMVFERISLGELDKIKNMKSPKTIGQFFKTLLVQGGVEMSEEMATEVGNLIANTYIMGSQSDWEQKLKDNGGNLWAAVGDEAIEVLNAGIGGFISGVGSGAVVGGNSYIQNKINQQESTKLTGNEQKVVDKYVEELIAEREKNGKKLSNKEKAQIRDMAATMLEKGYISTDTIEKVLGGEEYSAYKDLQAEYEEFKKLYDTEGDKLSEKQRDRLKELKEKNNANSYESALKAAKEKLSQNVSGLVKNERLSESYNERARMKERFTADLNRYSEKQRAVVQNAIDSGILNNTNKTHDFVDFIAKTSTDLGVPFDFTNNQRLKESGFGIEGKTVDGYVTKDGITLNINSHKALNYVVGHEITHVLEGTELYAQLQSALTEYAKAKGDYKSRRANIEELYRNVKDADIDAELTADMVGDYLFSDPEFVRNLSVNHRNVFQRIYDEIKYLLKQATAGSDEARKLEKAKKIFEDAYRNGGKNTVEGTKYATSISENDTEISDLDLLFDADFYERFKYEDKTKISKSIAELERIKASDDFNNMPFEEVYKINTDLKALKAGYDNQYDYIVEKEKQRLIKDYESGSSSVMGMIQKKKEKLAKQEQLRRDISESTPFKNAQFEIIQKTNPMWDEYHTGIRSPKDIKKFSEVIDDGESFTWGDFSKEDAENALRRGTVRVYSSYPIKNGVFVSTSYQQALDYAAGDHSKVHSRIVALDSVAWINGDEGQYAKVYNANTLEQRKNTLKDGEVKYAVSGQYDYSKPFDQQVDDYKNGMIPKGDTLTVGATPDVYKSIGFNALPMTINTTHVDYALYGTKDADHYLGEAVLKQLPQSIKNPVAVFVSQTQTGTSVVALLPFTVNGKQTIVPVCVDGFGKQNGIRIDSNAVTSVFGKTNSVTKLLYDAINDESNGIFSLLYWNKKEATTLLQRAGLQLPGSLIPRDGFIHSIRENASPVKPKFENVTESQQFKRWFGDWQKHPQNASKIVNADGTPKVVYHQTDRDFTVFDNSTPVAGKNDSETPNGFFFKDNDHDIGLGGSKQMAVYLDMKNPLHFANRQEANNWYCQNISGYADIQKEMSDALSPISAEMDSIENEMFSDEVTDDQYDILDQKWNELLDKMKSVEDGYRGRLRKLLDDYFLNGKSGYDGIMLDYDGHRYVNGKRENVKTYIVFNRTQIKSATDNIGTFDGSNPDIRYSISNQTDSDDIAPLPGNVYGKDIALETAPVRENGAVTEEAPVRETVQEKPVSESLAGMKTQDTGTGAVTDGDIGPVRNDETIYREEPIPTRGGTVDAKQQGGTSTSAVSQNTDGAYTPAEIELGPTAGYQAEEIGPVRQDAQQTAEAAPVRQDAPQQGEAVPTGTKAQTNHENPKEKQRKWVETSTESEPVNRQILPDNLDQSVIHYQPISNETTLGNANAMMDRMGYDTAVSYFNSQFANRKVSLDDIALGERLIQEAVKRKDFATAGELIQNVAILGTELGQKVQALSIIQRLTPEGQLKMLQKIVERGKAKGDKAFEGVEITPEMEEQILDVYDKDGSYDPDKLNEAVDNVKQQIADQMGVSRLEKVDAWRYLSMLGNPKTHIRNIVSNIAMKATVSVKNAIARTVESIAPIGSRTKTWKPSSEAVKAFARKTAEDMKDVISGDSKVSESASIKEKRAIFKNKILNKLYDINSDWLSKEDWWFSKSAFQNSLQEFLTANGIETEADIKNNPEIVQKGISYATEQSQIATFRQYSWLANKINDIQRKNAATDIVVGAILPFKKTPINIAKTGLNYSPLGFAKTLTYDLSQVKKGKMEASTLIDHLAQNTTGTALTLIGYMLASIGILNGSGDDDKEAKYDYQLGKQSYSVNIGGSTFSLSWLSPVAMPLFVGANAYEHLTQEQEWNGDVVIQALAETLDPLSEMSFLSSLDSVLSSYDIGVKKFVGIGEAMLQSYASQFIPTASSQLAATLDDTKRSTKVAGDSGFEMFDRTINQLKYKIPFLRETLEPSTDIWGNELKQSENIITRAVENFIAPYSRKDSIATGIDEEIKNLYGETGDNGIIPAIPDNYVNYKGGKYEMSASEYTAYKKTYGQTASTLMEDLFATDTYKSATSEARAKMVKRVYDYARDEAKREYLAKEGVQYTNATKDKVEYYKEDSIKGAIENDMTVEEYEFYVDNPGKYAVSKAVGGYEAYKTYSGDLYDIKSDEDKNGDSISGSRKKKVIEYINQLDAEYGEKIILYKSEYPGDDRYNAEIVDYLNSRDDISYDEMVTILTELGFRVLEDGTVRW